MEQQVTAYDPSRLKTLMLAQGRKNIWLAEQIGCSRAQVSRVLNGQRTMTPEFAERAARALQVPVDLFLFARMLTDVSDSLSDERVA